VLAVVLVAFSTAKLSFIQQIGVGLAIAVIMDATLVRGLLVPAMMSMLGRWNWWAPAPLQAVWRRIGLSEAEAPGSTLPVGQVDAEAGIPSGSQAGAGMPERNRS
jgi:uncharacterized membrane protein YdfJ with MMPL/SSD domain